MFKFVAVSLLALSLAACSDKDNGVSTEPSTVSTDCSDVGGIPQDTGEGSPCDVQSDAPAAEVPAEGLSAGAVPVEADAAADAGAVVVE